EGRVPAAVASTMDVVAPLAGTATEVGLVETPAPTATVEFCQVGVGARASDGAGAPLEGSPTGGTAAVSTAGGKCRRRWPHPVRMAERGQQ
ncbi:unnamed protein product, partial [Ectocarpus sp. 13 AM-2016]